QPSLGHGVPCSSAIGVAGGPRHLLAFGGMSLEFVGQIHRWFLVRLTKRLYRNPHQGGAPEWGLLTTLTLLGQDRLRGALRGWGRRPCRALNSVGYRTFPHRFRGDRPRGRPFFRGFDVVSVVASPKSSEYRRVSC